MSTLDEMWAALEAHQPRADQRGYGAEWRRMCQERTSEAARAAACAAREAWAAGAAKAAWATGAADAAKASADWAMTAIESINKAEEK